MPLIESARKKMRKDKKRTVKNLEYQELYKKTFKAIKKGGTKLPTLISKYYSQIDRAVREKIIHKNKGNRLKRAAAKLISKK